MSEKRISYRYAKAIFSTAVSENLEDDVYRDFQTIEKIISSIPELLSLSKKPIIQPLRKKKLYKEILSDKISSITLNFVLFLADKGRDSLILSIAEQYFALYYNKKGILPVEIFLATEIDDNLKSRFIEKLEANTGKKILPKFVVDRTLKGGFKVKIEDWVFDATLKNRLNILFEELITGKM
ncbi:MAG: ATP synthase F1 subunit delta [Ignavibacteria bacterium]|nr:ATP synthase F1 subunit delta [Ignavibacteria bacterium]